MIKAYLSRTEEHCDKEAWFSIAQVIDRIESFNSNFRLASGVFQINVVRNWTCIFFQSIA